MKARFFGIFLFAFSLYFLAEPALFFTAGKAMDALSFFAEWGAWIERGSAAGNEWALLSRLSDRAAHHLYLRAAFGSPAPLPSLWSREPPPSQRDWHLYRALLSQIPAQTEEEKKLLSFLEKRMLVKANGFFSSVTDWVCPFFGIPVQVHPATCNSYLRDPKSHLSHTYKNRVEAWKQSLPHPYDYPLILTRPQDVRPYLPSSIAIESPEEAVFAIEESPKATVDLTSVEGDWETWRERFLALCEKKSVDPNQALFIQRVQKEGLGGIRILPLDGDPRSKEGDLLDWVSRFGLTANVVEMDRWSQPEPFPLWEAPPQREFPPSLERLLASLDWNEKSLMAEAESRVLKGLIETIPEEKWKEALRSPFLSSLICIAFDAIEKQGEKIKQDSLTFFETTLHLEQIHTALSSLLEIFSPFAVKDFGPIYRETLQIVPPRLQPITSYGLHASGMTTLAGIYRAIGKRARTLYGENTYFECIDAAEKISDASPADTATAEDWKEADLLIAQFNPVLKRGRQAEYKTERVKEYLSKAFAYREGLKNRELSTAETREGPGGPSQCGAAPQILRPERAVFVSDKGPSEDAQSGVKPTPGGPRRRIVFGGGAPDKTDFSITSGIERNQPLTLALDCTLDYIQSERVAGLLNEFQKEIEEGRLNVVCFRSPKFDIFGMDNFSGAPYFMIHSEDSHWDSFRTLTDPALATDDLSASWFCLAFRKAAPQLDAYRKTIFSHTRALLDRIPQSLFTGCRYRILPFEADADPGFIDIRISGPYHKARAAVLVGWSLFSKCMEKKIPLFNRLSIGFYHPNFSVIFGEEETILRLTLGLDPAEIELFADCFETLAAIEGTQKHFSKKLQKNFQ